MAHVLVVDDEPLILDLLQNVLDDADHRVSMARDGAAMREHMAADPPDLVLLDVRLEAEHGFDLAREIRQQHGVPVIFVTGAGEVDDRVSGLELGAEDYITKPFDQRELLARINVVLRRRDGETAAPRRLRFQGFVLDLGAQELHDPSGRTVELTTMERDILACLATRPRQALSRNEISVAVSGRPRGRRDRTIDVVVSKLRRKLEQASPQALDPIQTVRGVGYKFVAEVDSAP